MSTASALSPRPVKRPKRARPETKVIYASVSASERYRPNIQRVTLISDEFARFICDVPDQFITFIFPMAGADPTVPAVPRAFTWDDWGRLPADQQPHARNYSVRWYRPESREIVVDMVLHDGRSIGTDWAVAAKPGDQLAIWGPRIAYDPPPNVEWQLLLADHTGLPALAAILESWPPEMRGTAVIEVDRPEDIQPLPTKARSEIIWVFREGAHPGDSDVLETTVRALELPSGIRYAWGGGEHRLMTNLGRYLRRTCGFRPIDVSTIGYWARHGFT
jgi:NADPH-dependent ferric siderophore reductase